MMKSFFAFLLLAFAQLAAGQSYGDHGGLQYGCGYGYGYMPKPLPAPAPISTPTSAPSSPCVVSNNTRVQTWVNGGEDVVFHLYYNELFNMCEWPITQQYIYVNPFSSIQQYWNVEVAANASPGELSNGTGVFMLPEWARTWGVAAGQSMNFGWIAEGEVAFSDSPF